MARFNNRLAPIGPTEFKMLDIDMYAVVEFTEADGQRTMTFHDPSGEDTVMPEFDFVEADEALLSAYTGTYYSPELDTNFYLKLKDGNLVAEHHRYPDMPMSYLREDRFSLGPASASFERDTSGAITTMKVTAGRVRNLVFERK